MPSPKKSNHSNNTNESANSDKHQRLEKLQQDMQHGGTAKDAPVREILGLIGDKWSTLILLILGTGIYGHADLKRTIIYLSNEKKISQKILTEKLRALERNGLVQRQTTNDIPPRVDYALTQLGTDLVQHLDGILTWIRDVSEDIYEARHRF